MDKKFVGTIGGCAAWWYPSTGELVSPGWQYLENGLRSLADAKDQASAYAEDRGVEFIG